MKKSSVFTLGFALVLLISVAGMLVSLGFGQARKQVGTTEDSAGHSIDLDKRANVRKKLEALLSPVGVSVGLSLSAAGVQDVREARIRWEAYTTEARVVEPGQQLLAHQFVAVERRTGKGGLAEPRFLDLADHQLLVAAVDARGELRAWSTIADPRVIRVEGRAATGESVCRVLHRSAPEFLVAFPENHGIRELRFYHPKWTGSEFVLESLGSVPF